MNFKQAILLSKLGVKVRCVMWQPIGYVTNINYSFPNDIFTSGYTGIDEDNEIYDIHRANLNMEWELYHDIQ